MFYRSTANDEMCNFYMMYYTDAQHGMPYGECSSWVPELSSEFPPDSDVPLPPNPLLEEVVSGEQHDGSREENLKDLSKSFLQEYSQLNPALFTANGENYFDPDYNEDYGDYYLGSRRFPAGNQDPILGRLSPYSDRDYNGGRLWDFNNQPMLDKTTNTFGSTTDANSPHAEHAVMSTTDVNKHSSNSSTGTF